MQLADEARHLFLEGVAVVFDSPGADVAAGREDVAVRGDFGGGGVALLVMAEMSPRWRFAPQNSRSEPSLIGFALSRIAVPSWNSTNFSDWTNPATAGPERQVWS